MKTQSDENIIEKMHRLDHERGVRKRQNAKKDKGILNLLVWVSGFGLVFCGFAIADVLQKGHENLLYGTIFLITLLVVAKEALKKIDNN